MRTTQYKTMIVDTINKEIRSKMLIFIFVISTGFILLSNSLVKIFFSSMVADANNVASSGPMLLSLMFGFINFWSVFISAIFGVNAIRSDFTQNIIYQYLAMPLKRSDYFFSRLIGTWVIVYTFYLYAYLASLVLFSIATHSWVAHSGHLLSAVMMGIFIFLCILFSTLFSFFGNKMGALMMVGISWIMMTFSNSTYRELPYNEYFSNLSLLRLIGMIVHWFLPRLGNISELANSFLFQKELKMNLWIEMPHLFITSGLLLWLGTYFIKRKDF
jgi:ABC-type transport system involved in multi-copper enzyme maturation permease subunit